MVDNSFVPRAFDVRRAKRERDELARKIQQQQSARNMQATTLGSGGIFDVDGSLRLRNRGELLITEEGEAKVIGEGEDFFTKQPTTIQACLANRRAYNSWAGYEYLQPGLYFSTTETRGALDARLTSRDGKSLSMISAVELLENSPQAGPGIMSRSSITVNKHGVSIGASSWDDAVNPGGDDGVQGHKDSSYAYLTTTTLSLALIDKLTGPYGSVDVSVEDPKLRLFGRDGVDVKGPLTVDGQPVTGGGGDWATITNKPATFPPSSHTHAIADVSALQAALDAKAPQANVDARLTALTGANTRTSPPLLIFRRNAALKLTSGYLGNVPWDATDEDATLDAADSGRMYAPVAGVYAFSAFITIADPTKTGNRQVVVKKNGTNYTGVAGPSNSANYAGSFSTPIRMAAGDYLEVVAYQNSGANATLIASNAGNSYNNASMQWLRP